MNKIISFCILWLCQLALMAQIGGINGDYDPANPPNPQIPETKYTISCAVSPLRAGSVNITDGTKYTAGQSVYVSAYSNTGYVFLHWSENGEVVSTASSFYYTMPEHDVKLMAVYKYEPSNPANPDSVATNYRLTVEAQPKGAGSFNVSDTKVAEGSQTHLYAYTNTGYVFKEWQVDGQTVSVARDFYYTMPHGDVTVVGVYEYNPSSPSNPNKNSWDKTTGEVIVDDFTAGNLGDAVSEAINGSSSSDVTMMVVAGKMNSYDFGIANNYSNCSYVDLSRTNGFTEVPSYAYDYNTAINTISLPACVENIGYSAFYNCSNLSEVICYAVVPPTVESYAFSGIQEGAVLRVLSSSIALYQEADGWKDFTILPLSDEVRSLEVNLPEGSEDGCYKNMFLELINAKSGQKLRYVISDRVTYTFNSLIKNTQYNVYVKNQMGTVLGKIEGVDIKDKDVSVSFESLLSLKTLALKVLLPDGGDVTSQTRVTWFDAEGVYLFQGYELFGMTEGTTVTCSVSLPQSLGMDYVQPADFSYVVGEDNDIVCNLAALQQTTLSGIIRDVTTGEAISGAVVSVSQTLNGKYSKAVSVKTDRGGAYSLSVYNEPGTITVSATDYISQTLTIDNPDVSTDVGEIALKPIAGATISFGFTYTPSVVKGETAEVQNYYSDYVNVTYSIYNQTQGRAITQFNVQYPLIVLLEEVAEGDVLVLTATAKTDAFVPVEAEAVINGNRAEVVFPITQLGAINAKFGSTDNADVVGILYDSKGAFVKKYSYSNATLTISDLTDGDYTLVSMASNMLFNSIYNLNRIPETGLEEGVDYVQNTVSVKTGEIAVVDNQLIPYLDEAKLYYTGDNTLFTVNKSSVVTGNYLTLKGKIDFKPAFSSGISDVKMIIDIPESATFVENSLMVGGSLSGYMFEGSRLIVPLSNYNDEIRFCIIPTAGGYYAPNAFVDFTFEGNELLQPIGSAGYTVKNLSITVPSTVAKNTFSVNGTATGGSTVEIYDDGVLIGQTTALANGIWAATCELEAPYNLSVHDIYAKVITKAGLELQTDIQSLTYDKYAIEAKTVSMSFYNGWLNKNVDVVFDFQSGKTDVSSYMFYTGTDITFVADLTNNDTTVVSDVNIYVYTDRNEVRKLSAFYDKKKDRWVAISRFESNNLPVNVSVDFSAETPAILETAEFETAINSIIDIKEQMLVQNELIEQFKQLTDDEEREKILETLGLTDEYLGAYVNLDSLNGLFAAMTDEELEYYAQTEFDGILDTEAADDLVDSYLKSLDFESIYNEVQLDDVSIKVSTCENIDLTTLVEQGYETFETVGGGNAYIKSDELNFFMIVPEQNLFVEMVAKEHSAFAATIRAKGAGLSAETIREWISKLHDLLSNIEEYYKLLDDKVSYIIKPIEKEIGRLNFMAGARRAWANNSKNMAMRHIYLEQAYDLQGKVAMLRQTVRFVNKAVAVIKKYLPVVKYALIVSDATVDLNKLYALYISIPDPCENDQIEADDCKVEIWQKGLFTFSYYSGLLAFESSATIASLTQMLASIPSGGATAVSAIATVAAKAALTWAANKYKNKLLGNFLRKMQKRINELDCIGILPPPNPPKPPFIPVSPIHDPSGYVYEGVSSNRLEGVTATAYYKETVEDMYGDLHENVVLWDAAEYAQENPLFTDENGMYAWDVPQGLWRVKFEKEGYQTTYSEWLPVPPPQLEVNIAMTQNLQPMVVAAHAYEDGVEINFDKYMMPETLTPDYIMVTKNNIPVVGTVKLLDEEAAYEGEATTFASKVYFSTEEPLLPTDEITLTVSNRVKSYAGLQMEQTYIQTFDVEKKIRQIVVDSLLNVAYEGERKLVVAALPYDAAIGKKLVVKSLSPMILEVNADTVVLDENGQAEITLTGELPGSTVVTYSVEDADVQAVSVVNVMNAELLITHAPHASRASGTAVYRNTEITLACETEDAVIYYTLDGSCPCDETDARMIYDGTPIVVTDDITIKAMAVAPDMYESDVVTFSYTIKQTALAVNLAEGWNWISHNVAVPVPVSTFDGAERVVGQTSEMVNDPELGSVGNLSEILPTEAYKVKTSSVAHYLLSGEELNAAATPIALRSGWNWIGYPVGQTMAVYEAMADADAEEGDYICGQDGFTAYTEGAWTGTLEVLEPGKGYLYKSASDKSFAYNTAIVSKAQSLFGKKLNLHVAPWAADKCQYPNVMPLIADVYCDGMRVNAGRYYVGAFCGSECRGIGKYVNGLLLMSIYGNGTENIKFLAADAETGEVYEMAESSAFTADNLGTFSMPYQLHIGDESTGIAGLDSPLMVTPAVFSDYITVSVGGRNIDKVVIFNANGAVSLLSRNVHDGERIEVGSLAVGAYVVAVVAEGETYYKKILKVTE